MTILKTLTFAAMFIVSVFPIPAFAISRSEVIRAVLAAPDSELSYERAKLTFDRIIAQEWDGEICAAELRESVMKDALSIKFLIPALIALCMGQDESAPTSFSQLHADPNSYYNSNVCVTGYLLFDRDLPKISAHQNGASDGAKKLVLLDFDPSNFVNQRTGEYYQGTRVKACGLVHFDRRCFAEVDRLTCIPQSIYLKDATAERWNGDG
ncbi:MAG: hypothetical protein ABJP48_06960 [Erythrobacter sp.]